jgi:hypothetical protein
MKRLIRLLILLLVIGSLAGVASSCAVFSDSHSQKLAPYKQKNPLPKKYIINNGSNSIIK